MEKLDLEKLEKRVEQLEQLTWSLFRALETYITFNDLQKKKEEENGPASED